MGDVLLVDGWCNLCHWLSKFVRKRLTSDSDLEILAIESEEGQTIISTFSEVHQRVDSVYLVRNGVTFIRSAAAIRVLLYLRWYYKMWFPIVWMIPLPIRDILYIIVSKCRISLFGSRN
jgi:predicted DCC family thiol-disulfide oxidoreductase YuxK